METLIWIILAGICGALMYWLIDWHDKYYKDGVFTPPEED
jgi:hypothetical protein